METHWGLHDAPPSPPPVAGALTPAPLANPVSSARRHHHQPSSAALAGATSAAAARAGAISSAAALTEATSSAAALLGSTSSAAAATIPPPGSSISATVEPLLTRLQEGGLPSAGKRKSPEGDVSSVAKRKVPGVKRKKRPPTNRKPPQGQLTNQNSPAISVVVRSPMPSHSWRLKLMIP